MDTKLLDKIKKISIIALVSDDDLMDKLVLKGGNAINLIFNLSSRASIDIDFSMKEDFSQDELEIISKKFENLLKTAFREERFMLFDYRFYKRPEKINKKAPSYWGGYDIEFKLITKQEYGKRNSNINELRRNAIVIGKNNSTKYRIDISKYEFCDKKQPAEIDGYTIFVYSPEMVVIEKLRAICQQTPDYKSIVKTITPKSRSRDFFDIYVLMDHYGIDLKSSDNKDLLKKIFEAKKVPIEYLKKICETKALHKEGFASVKDTISSNENTRDFEYYFKYVCDLVEKLT